MPAKKGGRKNRRGAGGPVPLYVDSWPEQLLPIAAVLSSDKECSKLFTAAGSLDVENVSRETVLKRLRVLPPAYVLDVGDFFGASGLLATAVGTTADPVVQPQNTTLNRISAFGTSDNLNLSTLLVYRAPVPEIVNDISAIGAGLVQAAHKRKDKGKLKKEKNKKKKTKESVKKVQEPCEYIKKVCSALSPSDGSTAGTVASVQRPLRIRRVNVLDEEIRNVDCTLLPFQRFLIYPEPVASLSLASVELILPHRTADVSTAETTSAETFTRFFTPKSGVDDPATFNDLVLTLRVRNHPCDYCVFPCPSRLYATVLESKQTHIRFAESGNNRYLEYIKEVFPLMLSRLAWLVRAAGGALPFCTSPAGTADVTNTTQTVNNSPYQLLMLKMNFDLIDGAMNSSAQTEAEEAAENVSEATASPTVDVSSEGEGKDVDMFLNDNVGALDALILAKSRFAVGEDAERRRRNRIACAEIQWVTTTLAFLDGPFISDGVVAAAGCSEVGADDTLAPPPPFESSASEELFNRKQLAADAGSRLSATVFYCPPPPGTALNRLIQTVIAYRDAKENISHSITIFDADRVKADFLQSTVANKSCLRACGSRSLRGSAMSHSAHPIGGGSPYASRTAAPTGTPTFFSLSSLTAALSLPLTSGLLQRLSFGLELRHATLGRLVAVPAVGGIHSFRPPHLQQMSMCFTRWDRETASCALRDVCAFFNADAVHASSNANAEYHKNECQEDSINFNALLTDKCRAVLSQAVLFGSTVTIADLLRHHTSRESAAKLALVSCEQRPNLAERFVSADNNENCENATEVNLAEDLSANADFSTRDPNSVSHLRKALPPKGHVYVWAEPLLQLYELFNVSVTNVLRGRNPTCGGVEYCSSVFSGEALSLADPGLHVHLLSNDSNVVKEVNDGRPVSPQPMKSQSVFYSDMLYRCDVLNNPPLSPPSKTPDRAVEKAMRNNVYLSEGYRNTSAASFSPLKIYHHPHCNSVYRTWSIPRQTQEVELGVPREIARCGFGTPFFDLTTASAEMCRRALTVDLTAFNALLDADDYCAEGTPLASGEAIFDLKPETPPRSAGQKKGGKGKKGKRVSEQLLKFAERSASISTQATKTQSCVIFSTLLPTTILPPCIVDFQLLLILPDSVERASLSENNNEDLETFQRIELLRGALRQQVLRLGLHHPLWFQPCVIAPEISLVRTELKESLPADFVTPLDASISDAVNGLTTRLALFSDSECNSGDATAALYAPTTDMRRTVILVNVIDGVRSCFAEEEAQLQSFAKGPAVLEQEGVAQRQESSHTIKDNGEITCVKLGYAEFPLEVLTKGFSTPDAFIRRVGLARALSAPNMQRTNEESAREFQLAPYFYNDFPPLTLRLEKPSTTSTTEASFLGLLPRDELLIKKCLTCGESKGKKKKTKVPLVAPSILRLWDFLCLSGRSVLYSLISDGEFLSALLLPGPNRILLTASGKNVIFSNDTVSQPTWGDNGDTCGGGSAVAPAAAAKRALLPAVASVIVGRIGLCRRVLMQSALSLAKSDNLLGTADSSDSSAMYSPPMLNSSQQTLFSNTHPVFNTPISTEVGRIIPPPMVTVAHAPQTRTVAGVRVPWAREEFNLLSFLLACTEARWEVNSITAIDLGTIAKTELHVKRFFDSTMLRDVSSILARDEISGQVENKEDLLDFLSSVHHPLPSCSCSVNYTSVPADIVDSHLRNGEANDAPQELSIIDMVMTGLREIFAPFITDSNSSVTQDPLFFYTLMSVKEELDDEGDRCEMENNFVFVPSNYADPSPEETDPTTELHSFAPQLAIRTRLVQREAVVKSGSELRAECGMESTRNSSVSEVLNTVFLGNERSKRHVSFSDNPPHVASTASLFSHPHATSWESSFSNNSERVNEAEEIKSLCPLSCAVHSPYEYVARKVLRSLRKSCEAALPSGDAILARYLGSDSVYSENALPAVRYDEDYGTRPHRYRLALERAISLLKAQTSSSVVGHCGSASVFLPSFFRFTQTPVASEENVVPEAEAEENEEDAEESALVTAERLKAQQATQQVLNDTASIAFLARQLYLKEHENATHNGDVNKNTHRRRDCDYSSLIALFALIRTVAEQVAEQLNSIKNKDENSSFSCDNKEKSNNCDEDMLQDITNNSQELALRPQIHRPSVQAVCNNLRKSTISPQKSLPAMPFTVVNIIVSTSFYADTSGGFISALVFFLRSVEFLPLIYSFIFLQNVNSRDNPPNFAPPELSRCPNVIVTNFCFDTGEASAKPESCLHSDLVGLNRVVLDARLAQRLRGSSFSGDKSKNSLGFSALVSSYTAAKSFKDYTAALRSSKAQQLSGSLLTTPTGQSSRTGSLKREADRASKRFSSASSIVDQMVPSVRIRELRLLLLHLSFRQMQQSYAFASTIMTNYFKRHLPLQISLPILAKMMRSRHEVAVKVHGTQQECIFASEENKAWDAIENLARAFEIFISHFAVGDFPFAASDGLWRGISMCSSLRAADGSVVNAAFDTDILDLHDIKAETKENVFVVRQKERKELAEQKARDEANQAALEGPGLGRPLSGDNKTGETTNGVANSSEHTLVKIQPSHKYGVDCCDAARAALLEEKDIKKEREDITSLTRREAEQKAQRNSDYPCKEYYYRTPSPATESPNEVLPSLDYDEKLAADMTTVSAEVHRPSVESSGIAADVESFVATPGVTSPERGSKPELGGYKETPRETASAGSCWDDLSSWEYLNGIQSLNRAPLLALLNKYRTLNDLLVSYGLPPVGVQTQNTADKAGSLRDGIAEWLTHSISKLNEASREAGDSANAQNSTIHPFIPGISTGQLEQQRRSLLIGENDLNDALLGCVSGIIAGSSGNPREIKSSLMKGSDFGIYTDEKPDSSDSVESEKTIHVYNAKTGKEVKFSSFEQSPLHRAVLDATRVDMRMPLSQEEPQIKSGLFTAGTTMLSDASASVDRSDLFSSVKITVMDCFMDQNELLMHQRYSEELMYCLLQLVSSSHSNGTMSAVERSLLTHSDFGCAAAGEPAAAVGNDAPLSALERHLRKLLFFEQTVILRHLKKLSQTRGVQILLTQSDNAVHSKSYKALPGGAAQFFDEALSGRFNNAEGTSVAQPYRIEERGCAFAHSASLASVAREGRVNVCTTSAFPVSCNDAVGSCGSKRYFTDRHEDLSVSKVELNIDPVFYGFVAAQNSALNEDLEEVDPAVVATPKKGARQRAQKTKSLKKGDKENVTLAKVSIFPSSTLNEALSSTTKPESHLLAEDKRAFSLEKTPPQIDRTAPTDETRSRSYIDNKTLLQLIGGVRNRTARFTYYAVKISDGINGVHSRDVKENTVMHTADENKWYTSSRVRNLITQQIPAPFAAAASSEDKAAPTTKQTHSEQKNVAASLLALAAGDSPAFAAAADPNGTALGESNVNRKAFSEQVQTTLSPATPSSPSGLITGARLRLWVQSTAKSKQTSISQNIAEQPATDTDNTKRHGRKNNKRSAAKDKKSASSEQTLHVIVEGQAAAKVAAPPAVDYLGRKVTMLGGA